MNDEESLNTDIPWLRIAALIVVVAIGAIVAVRIVSSTVTSLVNEEEYIPPEIEQQIDNEALTMEQRDCINMNVIRAALKLSAFNQVECDDVYLKLYEAGIIPTTSPELQPTPE